MFKKELQIPLDLLQLIALKRRIKVETPYIQHTYNKLKKGFKGEKRIEYQLHYLSSERYSILHNIRLPIGKTHFQIDFLLLSPFFNIIIDAKNIGGTLYFDPVFKQLIRRKPDGSEDVYPDPTYQVERQQSQLNKWLIEKHLPTIPIEYLIGVSDSKTILKTSIKNHEISKWISHHWSTVHKIEALEKSHQEEKLSKKEINKIARKLIKYNEPLSTNIHKSYNVSKQDIITGVQCINCSHFDMNWRRARWLCPHCGFESKIAHLSAIADYSLLFDSTFANRQMTQFLNLSPRTSIYLLNKMNIKKEGRKYFLTPQQIYDYADKGELTDD
ncbi:nuclease-related domain-containing protein [Pseudalkalibacillus sp. R45]|uniref:nuclease-related domain-containing protein n=1 Tax=Pseudalkalibacillus sp. R45 TaxID=3457433 RepID=UPI003FCCA97A